MEKEIKEIKKEIDKNKAFLASLKIRIFNLETKANETTEKLEIVLLLVRNAIKILERKEK